MNAIKFTGATSREVLRKVKQALGDDAVIIANRAVGNAIEVLAVPAKALGFAVEDAGILPAKAGGSRVAAGAATITGKADKARIANAPQHEKSRIAAEPVAAPVAAPVSADAGAVSDILNEIQRMRGVLQGELAALSVRDMQRSNPVATGILGELLCAGFSPATARMLTARLPAGETAEIARRRMSASLERRIAIASQDDMIERGGVFALIGPTGVGKTTTIAKLAARGVMRHGASSVALLTTDSYRIAAQDQLRIYGKILGVPVHPVKDAADLAVLLAELRDKRIILIDTVGMSQRDRMVASQSALLASSRALHKILLLNATANVATLEEVVTGYAQSERLGCIITKVDEAAGLAPAIDTCLRHSLTVHYLTNGQRVPEDIHAPNRAYLLHKALRTGSGNPALALTADELPLMMGTHAAAAAGGSRV